MRTAVVILTLLCAGCLGSGVRSSLDPAQVDLFGVTFSADTDYREIRGVRGVDEPCLRGFERSFDELDIVIGYGRDGKVRKIATRNPQNSLFGVHPGETVASALVKIRGAGFVEFGSSSHFRKEDLAVTIRADGDGRLFGVTLEAVDPADMTK